MEGKQIRKGMLLCAGLGTRLLPITEKLPKPLVPVLNVENVLFNIDLMQSAGVSEIIVNLHHLAEPLEEFLTRHPLIKSKIQFSFEPQILGTGGGVKKVETFFEGEPFVLANCDFVTNIDLKEVMREHTRHGNLATMVLIQDEHRQRKYSKVGVDSDGNICSLPKLETKKPTTHGIFTGVHIIESRSLKFLKNEPCGINDVMYPALMEKYPSKVGAFIDSSHFWFDTGEVDSFLAATTGLLAEAEKKSSFLETLQRFLGNNLEEHKRGVWVSKDTVITSQVDFHGNALVGARTIFQGEVRIGPNVVIGDDCKITGPASLSDCVVLPKSMIQGGEKKECLVSGPHVLRPSN